MKSDLTPSELDALAISWGCAKVDPYVFLRFFCFTLNQHEDVATIAPFPDRPHVLALTRLWQANPLLSIRKSRQMLCTWLFAGLGLWYAIVNKGKLVMLQSKRLDDAVGIESAGDGLLGRAKFILHHIPHPYEIGLVDGVDYRMTFDKIEFPKWNSALWAIPEGGDVIRQRTASLIISDESHFQPAFKDSYAAARPCIRGGGRFVSLSTANPGAANDLHEDKLGDR